MAELFIVKPCKTGATCEVIPKTTMKLKPHKIERGLRSIGYEITSTTPFVVVAKKDYEVSIFPSGRILIKDLEDEKKVEKLAQEIFEAL